MIYIFRHREADELKLKISKFKSGISMLQERGLWATQQQLQKVKNFYNTVKNNLNKSWNCSIVHYIVFMWFYFPIIH